MFIMTFYSLNLVRQITTPNKLHNSNCTSCALRDSKDIFNSVAIGFV